MTEELPDVLWFRGDHGCQQGPRAGYGRQQRLRGAGKLWGIRLFVMFGVDLLPHLRVVIAALQFLAALLGLRQP
jgi:hypothetical protein